MDRIPHPLMARTLNRVLHNSLLTLCILALSPCWLAAQAPPHATPAQENPPPINAPHAVTAPIPTPINQPGAPGAPPPAPVQPGMTAAPTPAPTPTPPPPVAATAPPTPATAPQVLYEAPPTTQSLIQIGGTLPPTASETLPTAEPEQPRVTITVRDKPVEDIFNTIREKTGVRVKAMGTVPTKKLNLIVRDTPVETVLDQIAQANQWTWVQTADGSYEMHDQQSIKSILQQQVRIKVFQLRFIDAEEMLKVVQPLLTPEIGSVAADARSNKLIVTEMPSKIALVESIVREYDVQVYTRVFEIRHAEIETVREQLEQVKSKAGEMFVDPVRRTIIVKDTFDKIKMMEQLLQILDRDVEMRVYNMLNMGEDGQFIEEFIGNFIEPLKSDSETAIMQYNLETGKLFVRDVRSVHDKILQILRQMDKPRKQVRIEGEIVSVAISHDLTIGTNWVFSHNLKDAFQNPLTGLSTETAFNTLGLPLVTGGSSGLRVLELTDHIRAELNATLSDSRTRLLLRPRITIANNEEGTIDVTRDEPVLQTYNYGGYSGNTTASNPYGASSGQQTYQTGLQVNLKPAISNRGLVELMIEIINTTPIIVPDIGNGIRGVGSSGENASTYMIVPSGETRVIAGLISRDNSDGASGIPWLSQLPWIGPLFGQKTKTNILRNLMFFITPTIIEEQPLNDNIVEPVNELAEISLQMAQQAPAPPATIGTEIPPELRPYLKEIQPEPIPMPKDGVTTPTSSRLPTTPPGEELSDEELSPRGQLNEEIGMIPPTVTTEGESRFLTDEPYTDAKPLPQGLRMGGVLGPITGKGGTAGPSGVFGGGTGGAPGGAARAGTTLGGAAPTTGMPGAATTPGRAATRARATPTPRSSRSSAFGAGPYSSSRMRGGTGFGRGTETRY